MSAKSEMDQGCSDDTASSSNSGIPFKKPRLEQWQQDPKVSTWFKMQEDGSVWCEVCKKHLRISSGKRALTKHAKTMHHKMKIPIKVEEASTSSSSSTIDVTKNDIREAEIRYCLFAVENDVSFEMIQAFSKLNQSISSKIPLMQSMKLGRTKIGAIIKNVINKSIILDIKGILQEKYFSIIIDESTDSSNVKYLSILVRFLNDKHLETHLLDLIGIKKVTAENIFKCITNSLNKFNLCINKIVGVGLANANVMIGCYNSLINRFKEHNSEIVTFPCLYHSMHLVAIQATKCIPDFIDKMLQDIYKYSSHSPKRAALLHDIQKFMRLQKEKVVHPCKTRWLTQANCIEKILNQWVPLCNLFAEDYVNNDLNENSIYSVFTNDFSKPYLEFLNYILKQFYHLDIMFQSNTILVHTIREECKAFIRVLATHFIKQEFMKDDNFEELNVHDESILLPLDDMLIGAKATKLINNLEANKPEISYQVTEFYKTIQEFYQIAYMESIKRLPYNDQFMEALNFLNPEVALHYDKHVGQVEIILQKFPSKVIATKVLDEWFLLSAKPSKQEKEELKTLDVIEFWSTVSNATDPLGNLLYNEIGKLAFICLSLPDSNEDVEKCFSMITGIKNKKRNKLSTEMICALARIKLYLESKNTDACNFKISDQLLQCFNSEMYNKEKIPSELNGILLPDATEDNRSDNDVC